MEFLRINPFVIEPITVGHFASLLFILLGLVLFWYQRKKVSHDTAKQLALTKEAAREPFWQDLIIVAGLMFVSLLLYLRFASGKLN